MKRKEVDLTLDIPSQDDVNAIYGEVSEGMYTSAEGPLVSVQGCTLSWSTSSGGHDLHAGK